MNEFFKADKKPRREQAIRKDQTPIIADKIARVVGAATVIAATAFGADQVISVYHEGQSAQQHAVYQQHIANARLPRLTVASKNFSSGLDSMATSGLRDNVAAQAALIDDLREQVRRLEKKQAEDATRARETAGVLCNFFDAQVLDPRHRIDCRIVREFGWEEALKQVMPPAQKFIGE